jgi:cell division septum initiation protein DivIVA
MAMSFSRPDPSSPTAVSAATFATSRKGFEQAEVRDFLRMVAAELARLQEREKFLERELRAMQRGNTNANVALDEEVVTRMLGEEAARILSTAREAASQIKIRAEENGSRVLREATDEAQRVREEAEIEASRRRQDASADAEAELSMAKQQGRDMVNEARAYRERVLGELARRREMARQQIEQLVHGRDRLLQAFERARIAAVDVMAEMTPLGEPNEYVNLAPTTGPVPIMVPARDLRPIAPVPAAEIAVPVEHVVGDVDAASQAPPSSDIAADADVELDAEVDVADTVEVDRPSDEQQVVEPTEDVDAVQVEQPSDAVQDVEAVQVAQPSDAVQVAEDIEADDDSQAHRVVVLDIEPAADVDDAADADERGTIAPVLALFAGEIDPPAAEEPETSEPETSEPEMSEMSEASTPDDHTTVDAAASVGRGSVDDLFAKLRASRSGTVLERARADDRTQVFEIVEVATLEAGDVTTGIAVMEHGAARTTDSIVVIPDSTQELAVFLATPAAPAVPIIHDDSVFGERDATLTPLIISSARKLKRVLADEQNDVLHALRSAKSLSSLDDLLPREDEHIRSYAGAITDELLAAALAGAVTTDPTGRDHRATIIKRDALRPAVQALGSSIVQPLRERLERAVYDVDGDAQELATIVRAIYREWKTQRIDEHLDDVVRTAFGRGAFAALVPGTPICWMVDPNGPACPDAEDNSLAGVVLAGDPFPTDHRCAPAHDGCRCMVQPASR